MLTLAEISGDQHNRVIVEHEHETDKFLAGSCLQRPATGRHCSYYTRTANTVDITYSSLPAPANSAKATKGTKAVSIIMVA
jgi:hypothetical protein